MSMTYFVGLPFRLSADGEIVAGAPQECRDAPKVNASRQSKIDGHREQPSNPTPTPANLRVTKTQFHRWQKLADLGTFD